MPKQISKEAAQRGAAIYSRAAETGVLEDLDRAELEHIESGAPALAEKQIWRSDFNKLGPVERAQHFKAGGTVVDEASQ